MPLSQSRVVLSFAAAIGLLGAVAAVAAPFQKTTVKTVDYNRDIRPLLSDKCLACHGADPKAVRAGLRLDSFLGATAKLGSGERAIVPGKPQKSEMMVRIWAKDPDERMPPPASHKTLTMAEKNLLTTWIKEGAEYKPHWAFVKPVRLPLPAVHNTKWPVNGIDAHVLARLEKEGLSPSPPASKQTLLRRVSLDVTGLPPTTKETADFLADTSPRAYEKVVDRLLASPRYGEKMAQGWMDGARYADSNGFQSDWERYQYRWRDWVIGAYNQNMPFDQFTIEQIAGDLLPHATLDQKIATGFNRNHRINTEGGVIAEEWRTETVIDRAETTSAVWMGMTMGCARCHDHKYDPVSQRDFYRFTAFFNNVSETGSGQEAPVNHAPFVKSPTPAQTATLAALPAEASAVQKIKAGKEADYAPEKAEAFCQVATQKWDGQLAPSLAAHLIFSQAPANAQVVGTPVFGEAGNVSGAVRLNGASFVDYAGAGDFDNKAFSCGLWINPQSPDGVPLSRMDDANAFRGWDIFMAGGKISAHIVSHWPDDAIKVNAAKTAIPMGKWTHVFITYDGSGKAAGVRIYLNGVAVPLQTEMDTGHGGSLHTEKPLRVGGRSASMGFKGSIDEARLYRRALPPADIALLVQTDPLRSILAVPSEKRTPEQKAALLRSALRANDAAYRQMEKRENAAIAARDAFETTIPTTMIMDEMPTPRTAHVLLRGQYDHPGAVVTPGLPPALGTLPKGEKADRLALARWIVDRNNPLTARVAVNRLWETLWGVGLVATSDDFGVRADFPSHPELLDWLTTEYVRLKWNTKALQKEMLMSATYRQSSVVTPVLARRDPANRLMGRGARFRLDGEVIRDQSLFVSGLLFEKQGGPSVRPYQPDGIWDETNVYGNLRNYKHDTRPDGLYRRSLYTIWKRTAAPPTMTLFDAPTRETCRIRRSRTNTPLQALTLLNETTFVESARVLAQTMLQSGDTSKSRIAYGFGRVLGRAPSAKELGILQAGLVKRIAYYKADPDAAKALVSVGDAPLPAKMNPAELAAYTVTASVILNMDETITKE